ncbi:MAG TPA: glycosyltransferase family 2 protein [Polyangiaceae bacterium]|nr:glycosyltransferase family 2 protein [Polyangiaceae bacterium]
MSEPTYSLVIPIYNEEAALPALFERVEQLLDALDGPAEVLLVDDGSSDGSWDAMSELAEKDERFKLVRLSRNFGHQLAITAGLDLACGEATVVMDADLQDPPEVVLEMARRWREGYDVVYGVRDEREGETRFKQMTASAFYRLFSRMTDVDVPLDVGDFRLVDRRALDAFRTMRENNRYVRGMFGWIGFRQTGVAYRREARVAGTTKYPLRRMLHFATDGIVSFSTAPLRFALNIGFIVSGLAFLFGIAALVAKIAGLYSVSGLASLVVLTAFLGGVQLVVLGVMGEYIGRIHEEVKGRPLYLVRELQGFGGEERPAAYRGFVREPDERG